MTSKLLPVFIAFVFTLAQLPSALGQQVTSGDWSAVRQLKTDAKLMVRQKNGHEVKGLMIEATDSTLTIDRNGKPLSIARSDIRQVYVTSGKAEKGKWAAIGAGIGAGAGGGIGGIKYDSSKDDYEIYPVMGVLIGSGVGAVTGLLFGQSRRKRELIYSSF
jgi:hypothetical protein